MKWSTPREPMGSRDDTRSDRGDPVHVHGMAVLLTSLFAECSWLESNAGGLPAAQRQHKSVQPIPGPTEVHTQILTLQWQ
jgi:hypothetical protein